MRALLVTAALVLTAAPAALAAAPGAPVAPADADLAGRLVIGDLPGPGLDAASRDLVVHRHLGGVVLFGRNVRSTAQVRALAGALHRAAGADGTLVTVDQEGGTVRRLRPTGPVPSARDAGRRGAGAVRDLMTAAGRDLARLDVDVDLAPVADLGLGGFLGSRSYGDDWRSVADDVAAAVTGLQQGGTLATAKHFPGLGAVRSNTDHATALASRVRGPQLQPFRRATASGVALVMTGHARYPGLGRGPASLQHATYVLLRGPSVGFQGVAVTDDLAVPAVGTSPEQAAVTAVRAGADLVLVTGGPARARSVIDALRTAVRRGVIPAARWREALGRVRSLQERAREGGP